MSECACEGLRRTSRVLTQSYERELAPSGIRATQMPVLVALQMTGPIPVSFLARVLVLDRTTLTRNLKALEEQGLVGSRRGEDGRHRLVELTGHGREKLTEALQLWEIAQEAVEQSYGRDRLKSLHRELVDLGEQVRI